MKLNATQAITVKALANFAANSLMFAKIHTSEDLRIRSITTAQAYIAAAKTVAHHFSIINSTTTTP